MAGTARQDKIIAIQLLRGIAASGVAIPHIAAGFADHIGTGFGFELYPGHIGQSCVALFFVVSGYVMIVSSRRLFGQRGGSAEFWTRRLVRITPPYWLATAALVAVFLFLGRPVDLGEVGLSLAFVPYWPDDGSLRALPFLWPGWSLFYEMVFYGLFGLFVWAGRNHAVIAASVGLVLLSLMGVFLPPENAFLFTLTRSVGLLFIGGMVLAVMREEGIVFHPLIRIAVLIASILCFALLPAPATPDSMDLAYTLWCGLPAFLLFLAVLGGELTVPVPRLFDRLGDKSYAIYLLHVPIAWLWIWAYQKALHPEGPWGFFLTAVLLTYVASYIMFRWVERPMTAWLNQRLSRRANSDALLQQTGV